MTDYTKLIERAEPFMQGLGKAILLEIAASFEALQADRDQLQRDFTYMKQQRDQLQSKLDDAIQSSAHWQHQFTDAQAENEQFRLLAKANSEALGAALAERDQLQAENERLAHEKHEDSELWRKSILEREQQISALQARLDAMGKGEAVQFLCDATRFKLTFDARGRVSTMWAHMNELEGRWVALVAAEDDCHLKLAAPKALAPLGRDTVKAVMSEAGYIHVSAQSKADFINGIRHGEKAHGIGGTP